MHVKSREVCNPGISLLRVLFASLEQQVVSLSACMNILMKGLYKKVIVL